MNDLIKLEKLEKEFNIKLELSEENDIQVNEDLIDCDEVKEKENFYFEEVDDYCENVNSYYDL